VWCARVLGLLSLGVIDKNDNDDDGDDNDDQCVHVWALLLVWCGWDQSVARH